MTFSGALNKRGSPDVAPPSNTRAALAHHVRRRDYLHGTIRRSLRSNSWSQFGSRRWRPLLLSLPKGNLRLAGLCIYTRRIRRVVAHPHRPQTILASPLLGGGATATHPSIAKPQLRLSRFTATRGRLMPPPSLPPKPGRLTMMFGVSALPGACGSSGAKPHPLRE